MQYNIAMNEDKPKKKKKKRDIKIKGVDIDKNEFYEIVQSNSNHPES